MVAIHGEAVHCETPFATDVLARGVAGLRPRDTRRDVEDVADQHLRQLVLRPRFGAFNPFPFMALQG